jgi:flagellar hook-associated protein FlgK
MGLTDKNAMTITSTAVDGIRDSEARLERTAARLAKQTDLTAQGPDAVSLSDEAIGLIEAKIAVAANVRAFHAADDIQKALLNRLG